MHSIEKIGGTSMSAWQDVLNNIWLRPQRNAEGEETLYQRAFVVSAYSGITNELLEHKKTGEAGVYAMFAEDDDNPWAEKLDSVLKQMLKINSEIFADDSEANHRADQFIAERIADVKECLKNLEVVCGFGHFQLDDQLHRVREMLSALGEAHSAYNSVQLLKSHGVNARFIDLTNWVSDQQLGLNDHIAQAFADVDFSTEMPIVTGYTQCVEGLMRTFDRGYSEMTFSKIATITGAAEVIIHKEYHLSTADPMLVGTDKVYPIGQTNYDVADQLANLGMEAIHPRAAAGLRRNNIILRIKNTFEPEHKGTVICNEHDSDIPKVEIIAGTPNIWAVEFFDQEMVGNSKYRTRMNELVQESGTKVLTKDYNANTVTFYLKGNKRRVNNLLEKLQKAYPEADIHAEKLALVSAIGSNMKVPGLLQKAAAALTNAGINILSVHQALRQVDMMFLVSNQDYTKAVQALHHQLIETEDVWPNKKTA